MHGIRLKKGAHPETASALSLLCLNSATMLGAEIFGRSYGGGVLKMEPREAATLPVPGPRAVAVAYGKLKNERVGLEQQLRNGQWAAVVERVDEVLLRDAFGLSTAEVNVMHNAAVELRTRRMGKPEIDGS